ncbi:luciferin 4-monooxygenase-like [Haemaphysalis longicornis]
MSAFPESTSLRPYVMHKNTNGINSSKKQYTKPPTLKALIRENVVHSPYPSCEVPNASIYAVVKEELDKLSKQVVMIDAAASITGSELLAKLVSCAAGFQLHGIKQEDRVCCHFANSIESFSALFGVIFSGAVAVLAHDELTEREVLEYAKSGKCEYIVTDCKNSSKFAHYKYQVKKCFVLGGDVPGFVSVSEFGSIQRNVFFDVPQMNPKKKMAAISFSSGSTGSPKAIVTTHFTFVSSIITLRSSYLLEPGDRCVILESFAHAFGFYFTMYAVCLGATVVVTSTTPEFSELAEVVEKHKVDVICGFPTVLSTVSQSISASSRKLHTVRKILCTGGGIHETLGERLHQQFQLTDFKNFLGCSEALASFCVPPMGERDYQTVGFPSPHVSIKLVSPQTGVSLGPGEKGGTVGTHA